MQNFGVIILEKQNTLIVLKGMLFLFGRIMELEERILAHAGA
jgi:hypothetical protein